MRSVYCKVFEKEGEVEQARWDEGASTFWTNSESWRSVAFCSFDLFTAWAKRKTTRSVAATAERAFASVLQNHTRGISEGGVVLGLAYNRPNPLASPPRTLAFT